MRAASADTGRGRISGGRSSAAFRRAALWDQMVRIYPPYTEYQKRTAREIPVVVLKPAGG